MVSRGSDTDSGSEDEGTAAQGKPIPQWARGQQLRAQLQAQYAVDPDQIFQQRVHTCDLSEVFARPGELPVGHDAACRTAQASAPALTLRCSICEQAVSLHVPRTCRVYMQ